MDINFTLDIMFFVRALVGIFGVAVLLFGSLCQLFAGFNLYGGSNVSIGERLLYLLIMIVGVAMIGWGF